MQMGTTFPYDQTVSYRDLAQRIGNPKAVRAVGTAIGKNPILLMIPCHRVIASDGSIGGYSGGI
jgi:O-6-methylguanine DNA methyltransferase